MVAEKILKAKSRLTRILWRKTQIRWRLDELVLPACLSISDVYDILATSIYYLRSLANSRWFIFFRSIVLFEMHHNSHSFKVVQLNKRPVEFLSSFSLATLLFWLPCYFLFSKPYGFVNGNPVHYHINITPMSALCNRDSTGWSTHSDVARVCHRRS